MHFRAEHHFGAPPAAVATTLLDWRFQEALVLPDVGPAELVTLGTDGETGAHRAERDRRSERGRAGAEHVIVVRYEYTGELDPLARRLLRGARLTWTQTLRLEATSPDERTFCGSLEIDTESGPALLRARAAVQLEEVEPLDGSRTRRVIEGELVVPLPGVGRMAERRILPGVLRRLDVEAESLASRLG